jgi:hypothetical protein
VIEEIDITVQKCCFIGCDRRGVPEPGFDFFACTPCLNELERLIITGYAEREAKEARN